MNIQSQTLTKGQMELTVEVPVEELQPFLKRAASDISEEVKIKGFRPGKAPYDIVKQQVGEMQIYQEAVQLVVQDTFFKAVEQERLDIVGRPQFNVEKIAPGNPLVYKAVFALLPEVDLVDYKKVKIKAREVKIDDEQINKGLKDLQKMQTKEALVDREVQASDKVVVDMDLYRDKVPVDGGQTKNHNIYLDEDYYIPGVKEKLVGMKKGETREFTLKFPKEHFQKHLAGRPVDFKIKIKDVYQLEPPAMDDNFAKGLGKDSMPELRGLLRENLETEAKFKEDQRQEIEILDQIITQSKFGDIPDVLVNNETQKMLHELEENVSRQGGEFDKYLESIKKTREDLKLEFTSQALKRVKSALVVQLIADKENIKVEDKEIDEEVDKTLKLYKDDEKIQEGIKSPRSREYLRTVIRNRKAIKILQEQSVK